MHWFTILASILLGLICLGGAVLFWRGIIELAMAVAVSLWRFLRRITMLQVFTLMTACGLVLATAAPARAEPMVSEIRRACHTRTFENILIWWDPDPILSITLCLSYEELIRDGKAVEVRPMPPATMTFRTYSWYGVCWTGEANDAWVSERTEDGLYHVKGKITVKQWVPGTKWLQQPVLTADLWDAFTIGPGYTDYMFSSKLDPWHEESYDPLPF